MHRSAGQHKSRPNPVQCIRIGLIDHQKGVFKIVWDAGIDIDPRLSAGRTRPNSSGRQNTRIVGKADMGGRAFAHSRA